MAWPVSGGGSGTALAHNDPDRAKRLAQLNAGLPGPAYRPLSEADARARVDLFDLAVRGFEVWQSLTGGGKSVRRRDFRPERFGSLLPHMALMVFEASPPDFFYKVFGEDQAMNVGFDLTGRRMSELVDGNVTDTAAGQALMTVLRWGRPHFLELEFTNANGVGKLAACAMLPLADDAGVEVCEVLSIARFVTVPVDRKRDPTRGERPPANGSM
ncbi:hypothetical protein [Rhodothalassium salexigens]|uniref:hypothetical protein n=1 Tax=Rhodothalassium salexigens TaxID=1086 RepID=UPI00104550B2|nr:hypothetical protein [Rhodothalassium salexigens]MBB4211673.1 hypothetical protein [Rhodothalassium salexigens DSM 2132]